ncbi:MAG: acyltransferase, partial [Proteobacteria bacterium]|nr:acyltransferase [Pseudomonadota bacterium]
AIGVLVSHSWAIGGFGAEPLLRFSLDKVTLGRFCVLGFFSISGFLIMRSLEKSSSILRFFWNRFLRIFPAYWGFLLMAMVFFVPLYCWLHGFPFAVMFSKYLRNIMAFGSDNFWLKVHRPEIQPLLANVPARFSINISLWSLVYEWRCYVMISICGFFRAQKIRIMLLMLVTTCTWMLGILHFNFPVVIRGVSWLPSWFTDVEIGFLFPYFCCGALLYNFRTKVPSHWAVFALSCFLIVLGLRFNFLAVVGPPALGYAMVWLALNLPDALSWFDGRRDISYGFFIYAWPLQQALVLAHVNRLGVVPFIAASASVAFVFAVLSRILVEQPALRLKGLWTPKAQVSG